MRFWPKAIITALVLATAASPVLAEDGMEEASRARQLIIGAGEPLGAFLPEAGAICRLVNKEMRALDVVCLIEPSSGSIANVGLLRDQSVNMAIIQSSVAADAFAGEGRFKDAGEFSSLRGLFALHGETVLVLAAAESKIETGAGLKGKKVSIGPEGGFQRFMADATLSALGMSAQDLGEALDLDPVRQTEALCNQEIDAAIYSGIHPMGEVEEAIAQCDVYPVLLDEKAVAAWLSNAKSFSAASIAPGVYPGVDQPMPSFGPRALFVASETLPEEDAYRVVKAVFDNHDVFRTMYPLLFDLDKRQMAGEVRAIPLHEGAKRFYKESKLP